MTSRALALVLLVLPLAAASAQRDFGRMRRMLGDQNEYFTPPQFRGNVPYDGRFTFARIKYRGYAHFTYQGPGWSHDYPEAEYNLMRLVRDLTTVRPFIEAGGAFGGNIFALDDPQLLKYPVAYFSEPGGWEPTESEVSGFRNYLQKGGFIIFDDFAGQQDWLNFTYQMKRVLPEARILPVDASHTIFDSFYKINLGLLGEQYGRPAVYYGIYEDNDPRKRILAIINFENDVGEMWEYSTRGFSPAPAGEAYKLGINYIVYALTH